MTRWWVVFFAAAVLQGTFWWLFAVSPGGLKSLTGWAWWGAASVWGASIVMAVVLVASQFCQPLWRWLAEEW